jgi:hypothetical protein
MNGLLPGVLCDSVGEGVATELEVVLRLLVKQAADRLPAFMNGPFLPILEGNAAELLRDVLAGNSLREGGIVVILEFELRGGKGGRVFLVFADLGKVVLDVDAFAELFFEIGFELLLLTASLAQLHRGKARRNLRSVVRQLSQRKRRNTLTHLPAGSLDFVGCSWDRRFRQLSHAHYRLNK